MRNCVKRDRRGPLRAGLAAAALVVGFGLGAAAEEERPTGPDEVETFVESHGRLWEHVDVRAEVEAVQSARGHARKTADGDEPDHLVYAAEVPRAAGTTDDIRDCVEPAAEQLGSYSIGIVRYQVSDEDVAQRFADEFMAEFAPAPGGDARPGVRLALNLASESGGYAFGSGWEEAAEQRKLLERRLDETLEGFGERSVDEVACDAVGDVEAFLELTDSLSSHRLEKIRQLRDRVRKLRHQLERAGDPDLSGFSNRPPVEERLGDQRRRARRLFDDFDRALARGDFERAKSMFRRARFAVRTFERLATDAEQAKAMGERLAKTERLVRLRTAPLFPAGDELSGKLDECRRLDSKFRRAVREDKDVDAIDRLAERFDRCLRDVEKLEARTRDQFYLWVYEVPALLVLLAAGGAAVFARFRE